MEDFTKEELWFMLNVMTYVEKTKDMSKPFNVLREMEYTKLPKELKSVLRKLKLNFS